MKCSNPIYLKEKKLLVPCGFCHSCRSNYRDMWVERLSHHMITEKKGISLMLSYNDDNLPSDGCVNVRDIQLFIKRFRKFFSDLKITYFAASEYGTENYRPHYHLLIFGIDCPFSNFGRIKLSNLISKNIWKKGYCFVGELNIKTIKYTTKYVLKNIFRGKTRKDFINGGLTPEFTLKSQGIGLEYLKTHINLYIQKACGYLRNNRIPRYYRNKLIEFGYVDKNYFLEKYEFSLLNEFKSNCIKFIEKCRIPLDYYKNKLFTSLEFYFEHEGCDLELRDPEHAHWYSIYLMLVTAVNNKRTKILRETWAREKYC